MINDVADWRVIDENPEIPLNQVIPLSSRAASLVARNKGNPVLATNYLNIQGAVEMMMGLDYHHDNFMKIINRLAEVDDLCDESPELRVCLSHEVVAYLNRLGQFHYFIVSEFVKKYCSDAPKVASTIEWFVILRMKHSAHRSIDKPQGESSRIREIQAMNMSAIGSGVFEPKPGNPASLLGVKTSADMLALRRNRWNKCFLTLQLVTDDPNKHYSFSIERDHLTIMREAYAVLESVLRPTVTKN